MLKTSIKRTSQDALMIAPVRCSTGEGIPGSSGGDREERQQQQIGAGLGGCDIGDHKVLDEKGLHEEAEADNIRI